MQVRGCIIIMKYFGIYFEVLSPLIRLHFFKITYIILSFQSNQSRIQDTVNDSRARFLKQQFNNVNYFCKELHLPQGPEYTFANIQIEQPL